MLERLLQLNILLLEAWLARVERFEGAERAIR